MLGWWKGGLHFFEPMPADAGGIILIDTYYFSYFLTFLCSFFVLRRLISTGFLKLSRSQLVDLAVYLILGIMLGARVGYILFYNLEFYLENPSQILAWSGMASHGAFVGAVIGMVLFARRFRQPFFHVADSVVLCIPLGALFIRFANFLNAELYGRSAEVPWAMRFPMFDGQGRSLFINEENQIYAMEYSDSGSVFLSAFSSEPSHAFESYEFVQSQLPQQVFTAPIGSLDGGIQTVARLITDLSHPSQLYQLVLGFFVLGAYLIWQMQRKKLGKAFEGSLFAHFMMGYGVLRVFMEFFRQPDVQRSEGFFQLLSMGQLLSLALILSGAMLFGYLKKKAHSKPL